VTTSRRAIVVAVIVVLALVAAGAVAWHDTNVPRLREVTIEVPGLAREVTVLQVSDLESRRFGAGQSELASLLGSRTLDAAVLTGDMTNIQGPSEPIYELVDVVRAHTQRVYYLPGNRDQPYLAFDLARHGCSTLPTDGAVALSDADPQGQDVALVYGRDSATIAAAGAKGRRLLVIASHTPPDANRLAAGAKVGSGTHLFIAGNTHGGQVRLPLVGALIAPMSWEDEQRAAGTFGNEIVLLPDLQGRLVDGLYQRDGQSVFVSRGLNSNTIPVRFLCQAEMVLFRFVPAAR